MLISRLRLGMHYPIDLFVSSLIAWGFHLIIFLWLIPLDIGGTKIELAVFN